MRLLFLSNYYPPHSLGGYEQWCQETAVALAKRGHKIDVLTSSVNGETAVSQQEGVTIHRHLHLEVTGGLAQTVGRLLISRPRLEAANLQATRELIEQTEPDAALIWGMWNAPRNVSALVEELLPQRTAYYFCDYWPTLPNAYVQRWRKPALSQWRLLQWAKKRLGDFFLAKLARETAVPLQFPHPICVSQTTQDLLADGGVPTRRGQVIYGGIPVERYLEAANRAQKPDDNTLRLIYIGRLVAEKGVHDALAAMRLLAAEEAAVVLDIYGRGEPDYEASLRDYAKEHGLENHVHFHGLAAHADIPDILARRHALLFTSAWPEPFARTVLEAMAAGLVVIGTPNGGTAEILRDGETGLVYPSGDAAALAAQIRRIMLESNWRDQLAQAGRQRVVAEFTFTRMVNDIEAALTTVASTAVRHAPSQEVYP